MKAGHGLVAGLLASVASGGLDAQTPESAASSPPVQVPAQPGRTDLPIDTRLSSKDAAPRMEFRSADGKPLPPEIQLQLEEQFRKNPSSLMTAAGTLGAGANGSDIVVNGQRPRGAVVGDLPVERTFNQFDIRAFGADNIGALLEAIGPQVASNRGRGDSGPVTLLNGRRVSDFSEIARIPTEAIERMEVFPEELALRYGYRADQKVVNVVTYERFTSRVGQASYLAPTEGGRDTGVGHVDYLKLRGDTRISLGATYNRAASLLENDRDVRQFFGSPELGRFRTLLPSSEQGSVNGLISGHVLNDVSATLNARFDANSSVSLLGLGEDGPLRRDSDRRVGHLGTTLGGRSGRWLWTFTGNYDSISTKVFTDIADATGMRDEARSIDTLASANLLMTGPVLELPAGPVSASLRGGVDVRDFESRSSRGGADGRSDRSRDQASAQVSLDLPLLSRAGRMASPIGNLSANMNLAVERLSDVGSLRTFGYGFTWSPVDAVGFIASVTDEEGAPTLEQLSGPLLVTPNVRTFDISLGEVVDVTRVTGGNTALRPDDRHVVRLGLNVRPLTRTDLTLSLDYVATRIDDPIAAFPIVTPRIEAAFPDRFTRNGEGRIQRIDGRPLNFAEARQEQIRWGINFTRPLGPVPPAIQNARARVFASEAEARRALPNAVFTRAEPGSAMSRSAANLTSRVFVSLYHNWYLEDALTLRGGLPALDLLDGGAVDFGGGRRRHEVEFQAGAFKRGLGARVTATWRSGTWTRGSGDAVDDLRFDEFATVNVNLFANIAERFGGSDAHAWLKGTRATIGVTNLFKSRPKVRDRAGGTPLSYQPAYLDPLGCVFSFNLRKVF